MHLHLVPEKSFEQCLKEAKGKSVEQQLKDLYGRVKAAEVFRKMVRGN